MSYGLNLGWGGTCRGLYRVLGGAYEGDLIQGSYNPCIIYALIPYCPQQVSSLSGGGPMESCQGIHKDTCRGVGSKEMVCRNGRNL